MVNKLRARGGIPFDFVEGIRLRGVELTAATPNSDGLMSASDKAKLDNLAVGGIVNTAKQLRPGANQGIVWDNDAFGGSLDTASITLEASSGEATKMRFRMTNDSNDNFEFIAQSGEGGSKYNNAMTLNGNIILNAANYTDYIGDLTGMIGFFSTPTPPAGWFAADGSQKSRTQYAALFARINTVHGAGDGSTTFNLPDYRTVPLIASLYACIKY